MEGSGISAENVGSAEAHFGAVLAERAPAPGLQGFGLQKELQGPAVRSRVLPQPPGCLETDKHPLCRDPSPAAWGSPGTTDEPGQRMELEPSEHRVCPSSQSAGWG